MTYTYKCTTCKKTIDIELPMGDELPKLVVCPKCNTETMKHDFLSQMNSQSIKVPYWFKATNSDTLTYKKDNTIDRM